MTGLSWRSDSVAEILQRYGIRSRNQLADTLESDGYGVGRSTIYRSFDENWEGEASSALIAILAVRFCARITDLVHEPIEGRVR